MGSCFFFDIYYDIIFRGGVTIVIDPWFHYHAPIRFLAYSIDNERYQNNGIVKHFKYNAIITGTSMAENFKTSDFDEIFGVNSIKVPYAGGSYKEISDNLYTAIDYNPDLRVIVRCLDYNRLLIPIDDSRLKAIQFVYDENIFNDTQYVLNKTVLLNDDLEVIKNTLQGKQTTSFDEYANWMSQFTFGKEAIEQSYDRRLNQENKVALSEADYDYLSSNLYQNVIKIAEENPDVEFYLFFSPYSIYYWDSINQEGRLERQLRAEEIAIEMMLEYENIHLFSFFTQYDMICDAKNYRDILHYHEKINYQILYWMEEGRFELTKGNYRIYCSQMWEFYTKYDYEHLFD